MHELNVSDLPSLLVTQFNKLIFLPKQIYRYITNPSNICTAVYRVKSIFSAYYRIMVGRNENNLLATSRPTVQRELIDYKVIRVKTQIPQSLKLYTTPPAVCGWYRNTSAPQRQKRRRRKRQLHLFTAHFSRSNRYLVRAGGAKCSI